MRWHDLMLLAAFLALVVASVAWLALGCSSLAFAWLTAAWAIYLGSKAARDGGLDEDHDTRRGG